MLLLLAIHKIVHVHVNPFLDLHISNALWTRLLHTLTIMHMCLCMSMWMNNRNKKKIRAKSKLLVRKSFLLSKSLMHPWAHMQANMMIYVCSSIFQWKKNTANLGQSHSPHTKITRAQKHPSIYAMSIQLLRQLFFSFLFTVKPEIENKSRTMTCYKRHSEREHLANAPYAVLCCSN